MIKDLAVDMDPFFDKWVAAEGVHHGGLTRDDPISPVDATQRARSAADAGIECINCSVCYAACDTVAGNPDYLGPAALQRAWTLLNDAKDEGGAAILDAVSGKRGCHNCHSMGSCTPIARTNWTRCQPLQASSARRRRSFFRGGADADLRLYMLQRITALLMAPLVLGHLAVMIYAIQGGLSAAEILGRTQGSLFVVPVLRHLRRGSVDPRCDRHADRCP